eukprot:TRINITY_DN68144_c5_g3_i15.p1 TRINITY_DN68144_c5_g3~~TRINITY_DN68144_c5_g3_i15.p1  ORF type:complete len:498 (-),score=42.25 TRINITY_DN68144_c5_g3_i15:2006-3499(-)
MKKWCSATDIVQDIRQRKVTCKEATAFFLDQINIVDKHLNAVVEINPNALQQAEELDKKLAAEFNKVAEQTTTQLQPNDTTVQLPGETTVQLPPLYGLPVSIKCCLAVKGFKSSYGAEMYKEHVSTDDHEVVRRLKEAGCVILCTTTMPEFGMAYESVSNVHGTTHNPYKHGFSAGGSSSGEGALVAAGASPLGIGTDIAGSVRIPAHFCGCIGLKATNGLIPLTNHGGSVEARLLGLSSGLRCVGPMARTVKDINLVLPIISGFDGHDPHCRLPAYTGTNMTNTSLNTLRVCWYDQDGVLDTDPDTKAAVRKCVNALSGVVKSVIEARPDCLADSYNTWMNVGARDGGRAFKMKTQNTSQPLAAYLKEAEPFATDSRDEMDKRIVDWDVFRSDVMQFFKNNCDVVVCPVLAHPSLPHGEVSQWKKMSYTMAYNLAHNPSVTLSPVLLAESPPHKGLPVGVQIVSAIGQEGVCLAVADYLFETLGVNKQLPPTAAPA